MSDTAIKVENLSKRYRIGQQKQGHDTLAATFAAYVRNPLQNLRRLRHLTTFSQNGHEPDDVIWAVKDVSFEVKRGEVVGVIGRNGAGKSTLLKLLSRITHPTSGRIELNGRVSSLLEVGTGFHPELTGRENIYLNGTILGMRKIEVDQKYDQIVDFSGVARFIDTPVKRYSSGMKVRLAFSVAAHLDPEVLVIDEVLAVGDTEFQRKCLGKMENVAQGGRTVLFVSHNLAAVQSLCNRVIVLNEGKLHFDGMVNEAISQYLILSEVYSQLPLEERTDRSGTGDVRATDVYLLDSAGNCTERIPSGKPMSFIIHASNKGRPIENATVLATVYDRSGRSLAHLNNILTGQMIDLLTGVNVISCDLPGLPLSPGTYSINLALTKDGVFFDHVEGALLFDIEEANHFGTGRTLGAGAPPVLLHHSWSAKRLD